MNKTYPKNGNPICPYSKKECYNQDLDGYTDCNNCSSYGNGVYATGSSHTLHFIVEYFRKIIKYLLK